jgi:hypothetical protein
MKFILLKALFFENKRNEIIFERRLKNVEGLNDSNLKSISRLIPNHYESNIILINIVETSYMRYQIIGIEKHPDFGLHIILTVFT